MIVVPVEKKIDWRRPPVVLIMLVIINVLVFAFYQSNDQTLIESAVKHYQQHRMLDTEWRAYKAYSEASNSPYEMHRNTEYISLYIVTDPSFDRFMAERGDQYIPKPKRNRWRQSRDQLEDISGKISSTAFGFHANSISPVQLVTSQFLHEDLMHLIGNLVFLVLVGFAVEAALGSGLFLFFYLVSGTAGGLFFAIFASDSSMSLIGASGSISGVMAMYVVLFGMRKIQFFYWAFIFTGYFRAAAIIMLPVYLLMEIYGMISNEGSNVAFTAHIGGFIGGAALVYLTQKFRTQAIDQHYLDDQPREVDPTASILQRAYDEMAKCEFDKAWTILKPLRRRSPIRADVVELEYNLVRALHPQKLTDYLIHRMDKAGNSQSLQHAQLQYWNKLAPEHRDELSKRKKEVLLQNALENDALNVAEQVFDSLRASTTDDTEMAICARQISFYCTQNNKADKAQKYQELAQRLAEAKPFSDFQGREAL